MGETAILFEHYAPNDVQRAFMSEPNAQWIKSQVEDALSKAVGVPVRVPLDERFVQQLQHVVNNTLKPAPGLLGLAAMNRTAIHQMVELQYYSLRQRALYEKYFIEQDRQWVFPVGEYSRGDNVTVSLGQHMLSHPWKARRASFLQAAVGLAPTQGDAPACQPGAYFHEPQTFCRTRAQVPYQ